MSRSGYVEEQEQWEMIRWRGAVASAKRGKRGQAFLRDLLRALDALPEARLIQDDLIRDGEVCAIGALGVQRGIDMTAMDPSDYEKVAETFGIAEALAREIEFENDERPIGAENDEQRFVRMRRWVIGNIASQPESEPQVTISTNV